MADSNERRITQSGGFLAATQRAGANLTSTAVLSRFFGTTKLRFFRLAGSQIDLQQGESNEC